jgi:bifunctional DNA-binding transcriptional regulator/antitoxin component of YhaV-PrlF toxin-antitoxin module
MDKYKKVQEKRDMFIQFSEEEIAEMGWEENQKLSVELTDDGGISLQPYAKMEIEIGQWPREMLEYLVGESCDRDVSVNDIITEVLTQYIKDNESLQD